MIKFSTKDNEMTIAGLKSVLSLLNKVIVNYDCDDCHMSVQIGHKKSVTFYVHIWGNGVIVDSLYVSFSPWVEDELKFKYDLFKNSLKCKDYIEWVEYIRCNLNVGKVG